MRQKIRMWNSLYWDNAGRISTPRGSRARSLTSDWMPRCLATRSAPPEGPFCGGRTGGESADERSVPALTTRRQITARQARPRQSSGWGVTPPQTEPHPGSQVQSTSRLGRNPRAPRRDRFGGGRGRTRRPELGIEKISRWVAFHVHDSFGARENHGCGAVATCLPAL
jgi:hypothetical protein